MREKERTFNDITMIHTKLWDETAQFPTKHFRKCSEWVHGHWAHSARLISYRKIED